MEAAVPVEAGAAAPAPEPVAAAPAEAAVAVEDESSTDGYDQAAAEAPEDEGYDMDGLDGKLLEHFGGKIVRKDLTALMKRGAGVPTSPSVLSPRSVSWAALPSSTRSRPSSTSTKTSTWPRLPT